MTGHMEVDTVGHTAADTADRRAGKADSDTAVDTAVRMVRMAADRVFPHF